MEKCSLLKQYAQFIACIRDFINKGCRREDAVIKAVDTCIKNGILSDLLRKNKAEVMNMILTEFDEEDYREFLREEARDSGLAEGLAEGVQAIISICQDFHLSYEDTLKKLTEKLSISSEKAASYLEQYWNHDESTV